MEIKKIATIYNGFEDKFGIPRQSGLINNISKIVFEPEYSVPEAFRGLDEYEYVWIIWEFSLAETGSFSPTVRPPRLGGNKRVGVFSTRSPFRPNNLGLSSVKLLDIRTENDRTVLYVSGADIMSGTAIFDIKPYIPFTDSHENAKAGFSDKVKNQKSEVVFDCDTRGFNPNFIDEVTAILSEDPRPHYIEDVERVYGLRYNKTEIKFKANKKTIYVISINKL